MKRRVSRREFIKWAGMASLGASGSLITPAGAAPPGSASASKASTTAAGSPARPAGSDKRYNILFVLTDQERYLPPHELPDGYQLPGHQRLTERGVTFTNHQIASSVCTPSRAVIYTGQHIQNNGVFDNTDFPWSSDLSTDIPTLGHMLRQQGYYTAYKGKWHLTSSFETINSLHAPTRVLNPEMEAYGFSDYLGIGDIIASTNGGYLHDEVIAAYSRSWLRGQGEELRRQQQPWFLAVNLVNPHDVMYFNTDQPGQAIQSGRTMMKLNSEPAGEAYHRQWPLTLSASRHESLDAPGRPAAHREFMQARGALVGVIPNEDSRWRRQNNYYLNCLHDSDRQLNAILDELERLGIADDTIVIYTADHGELGGAHGLAGKGATAYREQLNVPMIIAHPAYQGNQQCQAVTSHLDLATTVLSLARGQTSAAAIETQAEQGAQSAPSPELKGKDMSSLLASPAQAKPDSLRSGALYNFNMLAYIDGAFLGQIRDYFAAGGEADKLAEQKFIPALDKRGAIRSIFDGRYKFSRYFSPRQHHVPRTLEQLLRYNDIELFDTQNDPLEMNNLARDISTNAELILAMNHKLNLLIEQEVGEDSGQMLPGDEHNWHLPASIKNLRM